MEMDGFSDDEDREARMYAMLHFIDNESVKKSVFNETCSEKNNIVDLNFDKNVSSLVDVVSENVLTNYNDQETSNNELPNRKSPYPMNGDSFDRDDKPNDDRHISCTADIAHNVNSSDSNKSYSKKVTHAGRYWAVENLNSDVVNPLFHKINKPTAKQVAPSRSPDNALQNKSESIITLNDKHASKRKSLDSYSSTQMDSNNPRRRSVDSAQNKEKEKTLTKECKVMLHRLQSPKSKANKQSPSILISNVESIISTKAKKTNPITKKSQRIQSILYNPSIKKAKKILSLKSKASKKRLHEAEQFAAEQKFKKQYAKKLKNPFSKKVKVDPSIITLESSDDDDVIEVELPPDHSDTIFLDSSDESPSDALVACVPTMSTSATQTEPVPSRVSISPAPSIESVSDDFIEGDCSTLNISQCSSNFTFNFGLHGTDLCEVPIENTSTKSTKKSKKNTSTYTDTEDIIKITTTALTTLKTSCESDATRKICSEVNSIASQNENECFATPKSNLKKGQTQKSRNFDVPCQSYVTPSIDVYESESSDIPESVVDVPITPISKKKRKSFSESISKENLVESTTKVTSTSSPIQDEQDSLIMANVVGLSSPNDSLGDVQFNESSKESLVVDTISSSTPIKKRHSKVCLTKKKSNLEMCLQDMHRYYNTNWGEDFDHVKLKRDMPKGREFWYVDVADNRRSRKVTIICGFCSKTGHRSDQCFKKPQVCSMCGSIGHRDLKCPNKICLNCGNPSNSFTSSCSNCRSWKNILCNICRDYGHPSVKCPDVWRRYHLTVTNEVPLIEDYSQKTNAQLFCSGCTKRGHIINNCQNYIVFSDFKPASPFIFKYTPIYPPDGVRAPPKENPSHISSSVSQDNTKSNPQSPGKTKSNQQIVDTKKIKAVEVNEDSETHNASVKTQVLDPMPLIATVPQQVKSLQISFSNTLDHANTVRRVVNLHQSTTSIPPSNSNCQPASNALVDFQIKDSEILDFSETQQKIQFERDNTSCNIPEVVNNSTSSILFPKDHVEKLNTPQGKECLRHLADKYSIIVRENLQNSGSEIMITGNSENHFDFKKELDNWILKPLTINTFLPRGRIPYKMNKAALFISKEIDRLKKNLGNPEMIYKDMKNIERLIIKSKKKKNVHAHKFFCLCKRLTRNRSLLNMILIGQAGLCNGDEKLKRLKEFQKILNIGSYDTLEAKVRDEMGELYESIFSGAPRDDYLQLIDEYLIKKKQSPIMYETSGNDHSQPVNSHFSKKLQSPTIHKSSSKKKQNTLLTRLRASIGNLRKVMKTCLYNEELSATLQFLTMWEKKLLHEVPTGNTFQAIKESISKANKQVFRFRRK